ncbi:MAG: peptidylprolyl isomerase [Actinobacteria bacterium]|nr:peptidylprolyl isomerase [Actinomycetota bacterium]
MKARTLALALGAAVLLAACGNLFDTAAAVVAGRKITIQEVSEGVELEEQTEQFKQLAEQGDVEAIRRQIQQSYLSELIRRAILDVAAEEMGVEVTDEEVTEQIDAIKADFGAEFAEQLKESGLDEERLELRVRYSLLQSKIRDEVTGDIAATEAEIEAFYEENIADYVAMMRAQHILVRDLALAKRISNQLRNAPDKKVDRLFEDLARRHSIDKTSADKGGDLGITEPGQLEERLEDRAAELDIGEVSEPIQTQFGYHVIRVNEREITPLEDVTEAIAQQLGEGEAEVAWREWLRERYEAADIRINSRYGELDLETQTVVDATSEHIPGAVETSSPSPTP